MAKKYEVPLENPTGVILQTANKFVDRVILVKPKLQSKTVTASAGTVRADDGYCGLLEVTISGVSTQAAVVSDTVEISGNSGEFTTAEYEKIKSGADIIRNGVGFVMLNELNDVKCYAASEITGETVTLTVIKVKGKSWIVSAFEI
jgi:hypothetical protein